MKVGETTRNTLKGDRIEKKGGETKILKREQAKSRVGALKSRRAGTSLQTMEAYLEPCQTSMVKPFCENNQQIFAVYSDLSTLWNHKHGDISKKA